MKSAAPSIRCVIKFLLGATLVGPVPAPAVKTGGVGVVVLTGDAATMGSNGALVGLAVELEVGLGPVASAGGEEVCESAGVATGGRVVGEGET